MATGILHSDQKRRAVAHSDQLTDRLKRYWERFRAWQLAHPILLRFLLASSVLLSLPFLVLYVLYLTVAWGAFGPMPTVAELAAIRNPIASEVYSVDGVLLGTYYQENRAEISLNQVAPGVIDALLATEDIRFYRHSGVDLRAWARVFFRTILADDPTSGGGSTLSQQLAKNLYPRQSYQSYERYSLLLNSLVLNKLREVAIARDLEKLYSKKELLELYLNTVPFSSNTYGIKVAAERYFGKHPSELQVEEAATLVAMLKGTALYDPIANPDNAQARRNLVLSQMTKYGFLHPELADSLQASPICLNITRKNHNTGPAPHLREYIRQYLHAHPIRKRSQRTNYNIYADGLRIYTTIDSRLQVYAETAVKNRMSELQQQFLQHLGPETPWTSERTLQEAVLRSARYRHLQRSGLSRSAIDSVMQLPVPMQVFRWPEGRMRVIWSPLDSIRHELSMLHAGFVVLDPASGAVKAWVGGIDFEQYKYDHVTSHRPSGSAFKPVVYAAALKSGISPCQYQPNYARTYYQYEGWTPRNADNKYGNHYSMAGALARSINTISVRLTFAAGADRVLNLARDMGFKGPARAVPSIALGTLESSPLEMAAAYSLFANGGKQAEPNFIRRIVDRDGRTVYQHLPVRRQVLSRDHAQIMLQMLQEVVDQGTGRRLRWRYGFEGDLAGKTGTSQEHADGWFVGITPSLIGAAWVGASSPDVHFRNLQLGQGAHTALPIFAQFLQMVQANPAFQTESARRFPPISTYNKELMNCPPVLSDQVDTLRTQPLQALQLSLPSSLEAALPARPQPLPVTGDPKSSPPPDNTRDKSGSQ